MTDYLDLQEELEDFLSNDEFECDFHTDHHIDSPLNS